jgi:hypothetical protein
MGRASLGRILLLVAAPLASCGGGTAPAEPAQTGMVITLSPGSANLDACQAASFGALVTGSSNTGIVWSVQEGAAGGTITAGGAYTAPAAAGTYHVVATSSADATRSVAGAVTVEPEKVLSVAITPGNATARGNGTLAFSAIVTTSCGTFSAQ